ncbi:MAG: capsule biosynthesis protein CapK [Latescibacteria bacterium DG_63]|nr:MAG: capsule biosynthesis protein CapK [Latescibacteria bacterium DG_63]
MNTVQFKADFYSLVARHVVAPLWAAKERSPYLRHLKYLERSQYRSLEDVRQDQWRRLKKLLQHAYSNTTYYCEKMKSSGITPEDVTSWDDLYRIAPLTKDDIRANKEKMIARNIPSSKLVQKKTSGSTGTPLQFFWDEDSQQWKRACTIRHNRWTGWDIGERVGAVWGNPEFRGDWRGRLRNFLLERYIWLDTLEMDEKDMMRFYSDAREKKPTLLFGHAHSLFLLARFLRSESLTHLRPKGIISTAMVLHDFERKEIEEVFGCKVTNRYGCEEVSLIASECEEHEGLHMNMDTLVVEFVRDDRPVKAGEPGAIIVTDLTNYGMPFIRYRLGDVGIPSDRLCKCGRSYPLIGSVEGRVADYVVTPDGKFVSGISLTENFAMLIDGLKQMQIVQEQIDHLVFRIVKDEDFREESERQIATLTKRRFGARMKYSLEFVESIEPDSSGKHRFCISSVPNPFS